MNIARFALVVSFGCRKQAAVIANAAEIQADVLVLPEDGTPDIAALDGAVEIVPMIDPPDWRVG